MWTSVLFAVLFYSITLAVGDMVSSKTKGVVSSILFVSIVYIIGYTLNLIPRDTIGTTGLLTIIGNFGMLLIVTNLGTMINLNQLLGEWKTIVIGLGALVILGVVVIAVGTPIFGREYAIAAYPPIAGGNPAVLLIEAAAKEAGNTLIGPFAWLLNCLQLFVGIPTASIILRNYASKLVKTEKFANYQMGSSGVALKINLKFLPELPEKYNTANVKIMKLLLVTWLSSVVGGATGIPTAIVCLVLGMLFCEIGFLDRMSLQSAGMMNFIMFCMISAAPNAFAALTPDLLGNMLVMAVVFLLTGAAALSLGGVLFGKLLKVDAPLAACMGLNAMFGFPFNLMITEDVIRAMGMNQEDSEKLQEMILPKMIVAGFTTVTVASVVIAGIVVPFLF